MSPSLLIPALIASCVCGMTQQAGGLFPDTFNWAIRVSAPDERRFDLRNRPRRLMRRAMPITQVTPAASARFEEGCGIPMRWSRTQAETVSVYIHQGIAVEDDEPVRVFYQMPEGTTSVTLQPSDSLPPGEYVWYVIGRCANRSTSSRELRLTIFAKCDSLDFNNDNITGSPLDVIDFVGALDAGPCSTGNCNDIDFNNDARAGDENDILSFVGAFVGQSCP